jgi:hypothetical protein
MITRSCVIYIYIWKLCECVWVRMQRKSVLAQLQEYVARQGSAEPEETFPPRSVFYIVAAAPMCDVSILPVWRDAVSSLLSSKFYNTMLCLSRGRFPFFISLLSSYANPGLTPVFLPPHRLKYSAQWHFLYPCSSLRVITPCRPWALRMRPVLEVTSFMASSLLTKCQRPFQWDYKAWSNIPC